MILTSDETFSLSSASPVRVESTGKNAIQWRRPLLRIAFPIWVLTLSSLLTSASEPGSAAPDTQLSVQTEPDATTVIQEVDVIVYGGTPAGVAAACEAAREGGAVLLIEPTEHVGGLVSSGLSHTDFRTFEGLTGAYLDFTNEVRKYYEQKYGAESEQVQICRQGTHAEPHVAEQVFESMLKERKVTTLKRMRLTAVNVLAARPGERRRIVSATCVGVGVPTGVTNANGTAAIEGQAETKLPQRVVVSARTFIDATYEGDLMAMAGVPWRVGREGRDEYHESLAPEAADNQLQGYNFRFMMTKDAANRVAVTKPERYRREEFVEVLPMLHAGKFKRLFDYPSNCIFKAQIPTIPNGKYDINDVSNGSVRLSMPGNNLGWPDGDAATRQKIFQSHLDYNVGLMWFLQNDPEVPEHLQTEAAEWGWCRDEFTDNGHLPWQLYVREARRMVGEHVFIEADTDAAPNDARSRFHSDAIAFGDYGPNCHGTSHTGPRFGGKHTGEFYKRVAPYQIPYGVLLPKEIANLLVPTACSSSHVGFCALRLEPIWMSLGQAAGVAARLSLQSGTLVHELSPTAIRADLHQQGAATIYVSDVPRNSPLFRVVQQIGERGGLHGLHPAGKEPGERGGNIIGQYYAAFPGHSFDPEAPITPALWTDWLNLLPEQNRPTAQAAFTQSAPQTRGNAAQLWGQFVTE